MNAVTGYQAVDLTTIDFEAIQKDGAIYASKFSQPLKVQTPVLTLDSDITTDSTFALITCTTSFASFIKSCEEYILKKAIECKDVWFAHANTMNDDRIRCAFKSFLKPDNVLKLRVSPDLAMFDREHEHVDCLQPKTKIRAILELTKVSFGKHEFGIQWRLLQVQEVSAPISLFIDVPNDDGDDADTDFD